MFIFLAGGCKHGAKIPLRAKARETCSLRVGLNPERHPTRMAVFLFPPWCSLMFASPWIIYLCVSVFSLSPFLSSSPSRSLSPSLVHREGINQRRDATHWADGRIYHTDYCCLPHDLQARPHTHTHTLPPLTGPKAADTCKTCHAALLNWWLDGKKYIVFAPPHILA